MLLDPLSALIRLNHLDSARTEAKDTSERERERCRQTLPVEVIEGYERRRARHGESTVVPIERGSCSGCNIRLPSSGLSEVAEDIMVCSHCDRLIYDPELAYDFV
jgi:predicted  nucleic acid-binding Zn-ribbon protein